MSSEKDALLVPEVELDEFTFYEPNHCLRIVDSSQRVICELDWRSGQLDVKGNLAEGAQVFFEFLKSSIDTYIEARKGG